MGNIVHYVGPQPKERVAPGDKVLIDEIVTMNDEFEMTTRRLGNFPREIQCWHRLIEIPNVFSTSECRNLIKKCKNFKEIQDEYPKEYRNSTRELIKDADLAKLLFEKVKNKIDLDNISKMISPFGLDNAGTWKAIGVNEMMRFNKYEEGEYFKIHTDGQFKIGKNERSVYTLLIYLNDDFKGGETKFYNFNDHWNEYEQVYTLKPRIGGLALFNQDFSHEGCSVTKGTKYVLRTEIMYQRIDPFTCQRDEKFDKSEKFNEILNLLENSFELEKAGSVCKASNYYIRAQRMLVESGKTFEYLMNRPQYFIPKSDHCKKSFNDELSHLPDEILCIIFSYLKESEICSIILPLNRHLNNVGRSSNLWKVIYERNWNDKLYHLLCERNELMDWYCRAKLRNTAEYSFIPICIDFTSELTTFHFYNVETPLFVEPYISVTYIPIGHDYDKEIVLGKSKANAKFLFSNFDREREEYVTDFFTELCEEYIHTSKQGHPLLISLPPHYFKSKDFSKFSKNVHYTLVPAVCFVSRHLMLAYYHNISNCIVIEKDLAVTMSIILNNQSHDEHVQVIENHETSDSINELVKMLSNANQYARSHIIVVQLEQDCIDAVSKALPQSKIIQSTDIKEGFWGCQLFASQVNFPSFCSYSLY